jgi:hypothetical protein
VVEQRDGAVMTLNRDGRGAGGGEEKEKRKARETRRIGNREKGKKGERERGAWKNIKKNNLVFCTHFDFLQ